MRWRSSCFLCSPVVAAVEAAVLKVHRRWLAVRSRSARPLQPSTRSALASAQRTSITLNSIGLVVGDTVDWSGHFDTVYVTPSNGEDLAITADDAYVYRANGAPYGFGVINPLTLVGQIFLPAAAYPAAVECGWRGYCFGTAGPTEPTQDVWIYGANQQYVGGMNLGSQNLYLGGIVFSPDDSRVAFGLTVPFEQRRIKIRNTPQ